VTVTADSWDELEIALSRRALAADRLPPTTDQELESVESNENVAGPLAAKHTQESAPVSWDECVQRGRRLVTTIGQAKWELGDLLCSIAAVGQPGHSSGALARVRQFADEIGLNFESAKAYRATAHAWPPHTREQTSWGVHQRLQARPDRFETLAGLIREKGRVTVADVVDLGVRPTPDLTVPAIEKRIARLGSDLSKMDLPPGEAKRVALLVFDVAHSLSVDADEARHRPLAAVAG
jgi:hypothetical protein